MSDKQNPPAGDAKEHPKPRDEQTKRRRRRRKKPRPEQPDTMLTEATEKPPSSTSPKPETRPSGSEKPRPRPVEESQEARQRPDEGSQESRPRPKKRRRKPRSASPPPAPLPPPVAPPPPEDEILLKWSVHLFKRRPGISALVIGLVIVATYFAYHLYRDGVLSVVVLLISVGALSAYFFPISYTLSERGMKMVNFLAREEKEWKDFWTYLRYQDGVQLAYDQRKLKGRVRGGVMLYYDDDRLYQDKITEIVTARLPSPEEVGANRRKR